MLQDHVNPLSQGDVSRFRRAGVERLSETALAEAVAAEGSVALTVDGTRVAALSGSELRMVPASASAIAVLGTWDGYPLVLAAAEGVPEDAPGWASLRDVLVEAAPDVAEAATAAVALARWHAEAGYCPFCGGAAPTTSAGWARRCSNCDREHFPRTDPAIIVTVTDGERLLLGANAAWGGDRYSCFAGFVDAGESAEEAVRREVFEEAGVVVSSVSYFGSQAWPFPRSLMLGFHTRTSTPADATPDGDEIVSVRWFTRDEIRRALEGEGEVSLPGPSSISHALIASWAAA